MEVVDAQFGAPLQPGQVVVAKPDHHLVVADGHVELVRGPKENGVRPAVDPMLRSLASSAGPRAIAVILSGALGDGANGAAAVAAAGGTVVVQDPADAIVPSMPERALEAVNGRATVLPALDIGAELRRLAAAEPTITREEAEMANGVTALSQSRERPDGPPTGLTCPECNGALWAVPDPGGRPRYRCRIGHAYSEDALVGAQGDRVEAALWTALEVLEERAELLEKMASRHGAGRPRTHERLRAAAADAMRRAELLRDALAPAGRRPGALELTAEDLT
jgi:two-component system chemotaxis response regulator CheB